MPNASPIVEGFDQILFVNTFTAASNLFSASDPDGDPITKYRFYDLSANPGSGYFELNGSPQVNGGLLEINAADLANLFYIAGSQIFSEGIQVAAFDGTLWSAPASLTAYTVRANITAPVVSIGNTSVLANESIFASSFISAMDPDGWPIEKFYMRDRLVDQSYFSLNGVPFTQGQYFTVSAEDFANLKYNGVFQGLEKVDVFAWDGAAWSTVGTADVQTIFNANRPVGQYTRVTLPYRDDITMEGLLDFIDADGNTAKQYRFYDTNPHSHSGFLTRSGDPQPAKTWVQVLAEDLGTVRFTAAERTYAEYVRYQIYDGRYWSPVETLQVNAIPRPEFGGPRNAVTRQLDEFSLSQVFIKADDGPAYTKYEVYDSNPDPVSGKLIYQGGALAAGQIHNFSPGEFNSLMFRTGSFENRSYDEVYVRAFNGTIYGEWERAKFRGEPEYDQAMFSGADWTQYIDNGFTGKTVITYSFMQQFPDYETGEAEDNPGSDPPRPFSQFTNDQRAAARRAFRHFESLANVEFVEVPDTLPTRDPVSGSRGGTIRMGNYRVEFDSSTAAAFAFLPSPNPEGGDIWINTFYTPVFGWQEGTFSYFTFLHELGHAVGMLHPFVAPGGGEQKPVLPEATDNTLFTVMSYTGSQGGNPWGYSLYDISELQRLYGANETYASGNDLYDVNYFGGDDEFFWSIWDTGGVDEISAAGTSDAATIDLRSGGISSIGPNGENLTIAFGVTIENATGSDLDDVLIGNEAENRLIGGLGNDFLRGMGGNDFMSGGAGSDQYLFGIADDDDVINEMAGGGRDRLIIQDFPGMDDLTEDLVFRLEGTDLVIDLTLDGGRRSERMVIENQVWGRYRVETLEIGGLDIDLVNLASQATVAEQRFAITGGSSIFGNLVAPV